MQRIGVIGAGAWGTALAQTLAGGGRTVCLWAREAAVAEAVNGEHRNILYLPDAALSPDLTATTDMADAAAADLVLLVSPAQHLRAVSTDLAPHLAPDVPVVICAKGIEQGTGQLLSEVLAETLPGRPLAVLSGPTFAIEVARGLPTAVTLACADAGLGSEIGDAIGRPTFRPYFSDDVVGAQIGGAVKNVIAIACGVVKGRDLGENARAAVITRGLAEIARFGRAKGAHMETLMGLSGLGDLTLTCNSEASRNFSLGARLGEGQTLAEVLGARRSVAEGVYTASAVMAEPDRLGIEMPICAAVDAACNQGADIAATIGALLARPFTAEFD